MKKVLIVSASPRKNGNSDILAQQFYRGAVEAGNQVEQIFVCDLKLGYCIGCWYCLDPKNGGRCCQKDAMNDILPRMLEADVIVWSTPVYYYSVTGQMKIFLDRCNPLWEKLKDKDFYYMVTAHDAEKANLDLAMQSLHGFAICFENIREKGCIYGGGATEKGEIKNTSAYEEAYRLGTSV